MDGKLKDMARQALADAGRDDVRAMDLLELRTDGRYRLREYNDALDWALAHEPAADMPDGTVIARTHVVYIKYRPKWHSTNGTKHADADIDRYLAAGAQVLRVGTGEKEQNRGDR